MPSRLFKILVVDDDHGIIEILKAVFSERNGFECESVNTLRAAMARCQVNGIDLVVLDLGLNDAFGFEGLEKMLEAFPRLPILVFTGHHDKSDAMRALQMGAQAYITKPLYDVTTLYDAAETAIARQQNVNRIRAELRRAKTGFNWKAILLGGGGALIVEVLKLIVEAGK